MPLTEAPCYLGTQIPIMVGDRIKRIDTRTGEYAQYFGKMATVKSVLIKSLVNFEVQFDEGGGDWTSDLSGNYWEFVNRG